jgi:hypothetical protein
MTKTVIPEGILTAGPLKSDTEIPEKPLLLIMDLFAFLFE